MRKVITFPLTLLLVLALASVASAASFSVTIDVPTAGNATWVTNDWIQLNITLNSSAVNVTYQFQNTTVSVNLTATNISTSDGTEWGGNMTTLEESYYDSSSSVNVTIWIDIGGGNQTAKTGYQWWVDTIAPSVGNYTDTPTVDNTTGGDQAFASLTITENASNTCYFNIWHKYIASDNYTLQTTLPATLSSTTTRTPNCNLTVKSGNFTKNGYYVLEGWVNDSAGTKGYTSQNETFMISVLKADKWNLVGALKDDNSTRGINLMNWASNHSTISYIAAWNETASGFLVHQTGTGTNNITSIDYGAPLYIYPSSDSVLIRHNITDSSTYENVTLQNKTSSGVWSLVGNIYGDFSLSSIVDGTVYTTYAVLHNITNGYTYPYQNGFGPSKNNVTVIKGLAVWVDTNRTADTVLNRRTYS